MADIIEKIGKYFAEQEAQLRESYAHAAGAASASVSVPASTAQARQLAPQQPQSQRAAVARRPSGTTAAPPIVREPSLLRRRLSLPDSSSVDGEHKRVSLVGGQVKAPSPSPLVVPSPSSDDDERDQGGPAGRAATHVRHVEMGEEHDAESDDHEEQVEALSVSASSSKPRLQRRGSSSSTTTTTSSTSSSARKSGKKKAKTKKKRKGSNTEEQVDSEALARERARRAADGLARAQERARRIQIEKLQQEKLQEQEREEAQARVLEQMRKIEEIRRKGKQFAMRLRPQSAPSTAQHTPASHSVPAEEDAGALAERADELRLSRRTRGFLDELERQTHDRMLMEMRINERIQKKQQQHEHGWARLQAQLKKQTVRNALKQERVNSLAATKLALEEEIASAQQEAAACRQERRQLEDASKKESLQRQREAEREIQARLRREEARKLEEEERGRSNSAAAARARAKERVSSRAALLKRVLHGFDVAATKKQNNQQNEDDDFMRIGDSTTSKEEEGKTSLLAAAAPAPIKNEWLLPPELAEFEEDGLSSVRLGDVAGVAAPSEGGPEVDESPPSAKWVNAAVQWRVPPLSADRIREILHAELLPLLHTSDDDE